MKKVLLTTTALTLAAGVASAEITFSGKGEAGFYRNAPTAAVAAVAGLDMDVDGGAVADTEGNWDYNDDGLLAFTAATGDAGEGTDADIDTARGLLAVEQDAYSDDIATMEAATTEAARNDAANDALVHLAEIKRLEAQIGSLTGSAATGKGATPNLASYSGYDFDVTVSGASDNGMTFAMGFDMGAGLIADQDDDRAMDAQGGAIATSAMTIGYAGYTIEIGDDKIDDVYDDTQNGDVAISGALGDLTFKIVHDMDDDVQAVAGGWVYTAETAADAARESTDADWAAGSLVERAAVAAVYNTTSYSLGYTMGDVAFAMASTDHDDRGNAASSFSLSYTVSDSLSATYSVDNVGTFKDIAKLSATAKISDMLSITASVKDDKDHALNTNTGGKQSQDVSISYAAGSLGATIATDESSNWWVNAQYDLGGGAQAFTTFDHTEFLVAGVNFAF
jgi:hypothetical protein